MKKLIAFILAVYSSALLAGCKNNVKNEIINWDTVPTITIDNSRYIAKGIPTATLPDEYELVGTIADSEYEGCKYYSDSKVDDVYLYQECGVAINDSEVDTTQRQWAYIQWVIIDN